MRRTEKISVQPSILFSALLAALISFGAVRGTCAPGPALTPSPAQASQTSPETEDLKNPNPKIRIRTVRELGESGDPSAIPALASALSDPDAKVRRQVVISLASIRVPASLNALVRATTDSDEEVRWLAVRGIEGYYTGKVPKSGFFAFMERQYRNAKKHFIESDEQVPPGTAIDPSAVSALDRTMMDNRYLKASREATRALGILLAKGAVPDLVKTAHSPDEDLSREALNSLQKIKDVSVGPQLVDLLNSSDTKIKQDAAVTVGILRTRAAVPRLQAMYENSSNKVTRQKALAGLAYIGDPISGPLFLKALWDPDKSIRTAAAEGLARSKYQQALPDLLRAAPSEKDALARLAMEFAITAMGNNDYVSAIINELGSGNEDTAQSYLIELARNPGFLSKLYPYMNSRNSDVRLRLCNVLMYSGDATSLGPLERASHDENGDVAAAALNALRVVRARVSGHGSS